MDLNKQADLFWNLHIKMFVEGHRKISDDFYRLYTGTLKEIKREEERKKKEDDFYYYD